MFITLVKNLNKKISSTSGTPQKFRVIQQLTDRQFKEKLAIEKMSANRRLQKVII